MVEAKKVVTIIGVAIATFVEPVLVARWTIEQTPEEHRDIQGALAQLKTDPETKIFSLDSIMPGDSPIGICTQSKFPEVIAIKMSEDTSWVLCAPQGRVNLP
jgi:hypothetical protein